MKARTEMGIHEGDGDQAVKFYIPPQVQGVLFTPEQIESHVRLLADLINEEYKGRDPLLVGVLKGAFVFLSDLARRLKIEYAIDFISVASYGMAGTARGEVRIVMDTRIPMMGRDVILVEDIVDSGATLNFLAALFGQRDPKSLIAITLTTKSEHLPEIIPVRYQALTIDPNRWAVGYGLDLKEQYRALPFIGWVSPQG
jgi:hypoxanthine phosphoribosyltransferase